MVILQTHMQPGLLYVTFSAHRFFADAHLIDAFSMVPPNRGLASAGHKASGSLLAMSEDECKPDGLGRVQTSMQADAVTCHKFLHFPWRYGSLFCSPAIIRG
ncbi:TPA: hypothetical protein ACH3X2_012475 [Trebouxia sp. C0005]